MGNDELGGITKALKSRGKTGRGSFGLVPEHVEKSCNRRRRFTFQTGGDKLKWRRVGGNGDEGYFGVVKGANATKRGGDTDFRSHRHPHRSHSFGLPDRQ